MTGLGRVCEVRLYVKKMCLLDPPWHYNFTVSLIKPYTEMMLRVPVSTVTGELTYQAEEPIFLRQTMITAIFARLVGYNLMIL